MTVKEDSIVRIFLINGMTVIKKTHVFDLFFFYVTVILSLARKSLLCR